MSSARFGLGTYILNSVIARGNIFLLDLLLISLHISSTVKEFTPKKNNAFDHKCFIHRKLWNMFSIILDNIKAK